MPVTAQWNIPERLIARPVLSDVSVAGVSLIVTGKCRPLSCIFEYYWGNFLLLACTAREVNREQQPSYYYWIHWNFSCCFLFFCLLQKSALREKLPAAQQAYQNIMQAHKQKFNAQATRAYCVTDTHAVGHALALVVIGAFLLLRKPQYASLL